MSDRTFRLILDGKKGGLVKGSTPSSAAKKAYKKLSAENGKSSFNFELQETTKDSKKKVYGPYKGCLEKDKIKVKIFLFFQLILRSKMEPLWGENQTLFNRIPNLYYFL